VDLSVFFVGTAGSVPSRGRGLPAVLVQRGGERLLFDCGEGTQRQLLRSIGLPDIERVFITHFHADHWLGLPGMLKSFALRDRSAPLVVYGPRGLRQLMDAMLVVYGKRLPYKLDLIELEPWDEIDFPDFQIASIPVTHKGNEAYAYVLTEDERPGEFDPAAAIDLGVDEGPLFGRLQRGEAVEVERDGRRVLVEPADVMGESRLGRRVAFSGDTTPCEALRFAADGAQLLVHESTFLTADAERARETGHSTARQAALIAADAGTQMLALTHISARYSAREMLDEARPVFEHTVAPRDFDTIVVPQPERGGPELVVWAERRGDPGIERVASA